jgi:Tfp pilus assembly protein PilV
MPTDANPSRREAGFTLVEAMVAMLVVALVVISFIGIRTSALLDATYARNWRLARELAEEKMSELMAGARETRPQSGDLIPLEKYRGFGYRVLIGEADIANIEAEIADNAAGDDSAAGERVEWQREREDYRRASARGLSRADYDAQRNEDINLRLAEKAPSATEFEEVAVVVYFPKLEADKPDATDALLIKARLSTLAISGLTPEQAEALQQAQGGSSGAASGEGGGLPGAGGSSGGGGGAGLLPGAK